MEVLNPCVSAFVSTHTLSRLRNFPAFAALVSFSSYYVKKKKGKTPLHKSMSELYRPSDCHLSAKLVTTFVNRGCYVVSSADPPRP
jgi:hypothetical protein